jgi:hypothetical protein
MDHEEAYTRLLNHASLLAGRTPLPDEESLHFILFKADQERIPPARMEVLYEDILSSLEIVNHALNGAEPSEAVTGKETHVGRGLAYAMWMIIDDGWRFYHRWGAERVFERQTLEQLSRVISGVSCAWGAVLAGDINSVREHVELEGF